MIVVPGSAVPLMVGVLHEVVRLLVMTGEEGRKVSLTPCAPCNNRRTNLLMVKV